MNTRPEADPITEPTKTWLRDMLRARHLDYLRTLNPTIAMNVTRDIAAFIDFVCPPELTPQEVELAQLKARVADLEDEICTKPIVGNDRHNIRQEFFDAVQYGLRAVGRKCDVRATNAMCKQLHTEKYIAVMVNGFVTEILNPHMCGFDVSQVPDTIARMYSAK